MKLKKILACVITIAAAVFCMAGCGEDTSVQDEALHRQLMGAWVPLNDYELEYDGEGNVVKFSVYEFTETETRYHIVRSDSTYSSFVNEYSISGGRYKVSTEMGPQYAGIKFTETGNLVWFTDDSSDEFRPLTEEEKTEFVIPLNQENFRGSPKYTENPPEGAESAASAAE